ncbi:MAG: S-adenosylmethionine:tRNA ribosyltransferase-isomerase [Acidobacteriota bacterium]
MTALDFTLPPQLEAREPAELRGSGRDDVRMMVSDLATGAMSHAHFRDLPRFLRPGDLLVLNTSATLPAALTAIRGNGDAIDLHWSTPLPGGLAVVEPRVALTRRFAPPSPAERERVAEGGVRAVAGETLVLPGGGRATLLAPYRDSRRLWIAQLELDLPVADYLRRWGRPIAYSYIPRPFPISAYQTVYARSEGSAEMPSAGRAFTRPMLACLRKSGVQLAKLVLHTGVASLETHERPYEEWYEVPLRTAEKVRAAKARGGRVIAVGTTVVRALESSVDAHGDVVASRGWTEMVITPERGVRVVDGLLTGLHEPRATHLAMLEAIAGRATIETAYAEALERGYLWHEFGDVHLLA